MLHQEGFARGRERSFSVIEFGSSRERQNNDLLPYLDAFKQYFASLPKHYSHIHIHLRTVPLRDIECVTETVFRADQLLRNVTDKIGTIPFSDEMFF